MAAHWTVYPAMRSRPWSANAPYAYECRRVSDWEHEGAQRHADAGSVPRLGRAVYGN